MKTFSFLVALAVISAAASAQELTGVKVDFRSQIGSQKRIKQVPEVPEKSAAQDSAGSYGCSLSLRNSVFTQTEKALAVKRFCDAYEDYQPQWTGGQVLALLGTPIGARTLEKIEAAKTAMLEARSKAARTGGLKILVKTDPGGGTGDPDDRPVVVLLKPGADYLPND